MRVLILTFFILATSLRANAFSFEVDALYFSDNFVNSSTETAAQTFYDLSLYLNLDKKGRFILGWGLSSQSFSETDTSTTTYALSEMGPRLAYYFNRDKNMGLFLSYNMTATATYNTGSSQELRGSSYKASFSFAPNLDEDEMYYIGGKLNYSVAAYPESVASNTITNVSFSRTTIYPSIHFIMHFNN